MCAMIVIEKITDKKLPQALEELIFVPLGMKDSQAMFYTYEKEKRLKPLPIFIENIDVSEFTSLSCDQADGGIVSTPHDLVIFEKAR